MVVAALACDVIMMVVVVVVMLTVGESNCDNDCVGVIGTYRW